MSRDVIERKEFEYAPTVAGVIQLFAVDAGWACVGLYARVDVARVGGTSVLVGETAGDTDGFFTEAEIDSDGTPGLRSASGAFLAGAGGHIYLVNDTIDAVLLGSPSPMPVIKFVAMLRRVIGT
jgi:hypothetical protein